MLGLRSATVGRLRTLGLPSSAGRSESMLDPQVAGEATHFGALLAIDERDPDTGPPGTCRAPDPMNVGLVV